jgi:hypothetical protein
VGIVYCLELTGCGKAWEKISTGLIRVQQLWKPASPWMRQPRTNHLRSTYSSELYRCSIHSLKHSSLPPETRLEHAPAGRGHIHCREFYCVKRTEAQKRHLWRPARSRSMDWGTYGSPRRTKGRSRNFAVGEHGAHNQHGVQGGYLDTMK